MSTFRVAAIVNEPLHVLSRFVSWHLETGATGITLFFDNPDDPAIEHCAADPRVSPVRCTPEFWEGIGQDPAARFTRRQNAAMTEAYRRTNEDWLLVLDADELVYLAHSSVSQLLAAQPVGLRSLMVEPAEFVHAPGDGANFRMPLSKPDVNQIYGAAAGLLRKRYGLIGHSIGKAFHRRGQSNIRLRQHWAVDSSREVVPFGSVGRAEGAHLLHYIAPSFDAWRVKMEWRLSASGFTSYTRDQIEAIMAQSGDREAGLAVLYERMHCVDRDTAERLRAKGGLLELPADFRPAAA